MHIRANLIADRHAAEAKRAECSQRDVLIKKAETLLKSMLNSDVVKNDHNLMLRILAHGRKLDIYKNNPATELASVRSVWGELLQMCQSEPSFLSMIKQETRSPK